MDHPEYLDPPHYDGSRLFFWVSKASGVPIDLVNFVIGQLFALLFAAIYRTAFHPSKASPTKRHCAALVGGVTLLYFCFGRHAYLVIFLTGVSYFITVFFPAKYVPQIILPLSLVYMGCVHIRRQLMSQTGFSLDVSAPVMVAVQKVTSIAFAWKDGSEKDQDKLTPLQKLQAVRKIPSMLEYFSYILHFQACMTGPTVLYKDYIDYIYGTNYRKHIKSEDILEDSPCSAIPVQDPSPTKAVITKVVVSLIHAVIFICICPMFSVGRFKDEEFFVSTTFYHRMFYIIIVTTLARSKYYHAWLLADAICNASGLGFNGWDDHGNTKWDLISNVKIVDIEFATSFRDTLSSWNIGTMRWLRYVGYERATFNPTVATYILSALWHGFYPGYYLTFIFGALLTGVGRTLRRHVRPRFQSTNCSRKIYDVLTFLGSRVALAYVTMPFVVLEFWPSIRVYSSLYWYLHVLTILALVAVPKIFPAHREKMSTKSEGVHESN